MKAKIVKVIPKVMGLKKGETYKVVKVADDKEGVWVEDSSHNVVFVKSSNVELLQEDGVGKYEDGLITVIFQEMFPKTVSFDPQKKELRATW